MRPSKYLACLLALGVLATSALAGAQPEPDNYSYRFTDDDLLGDTLTSPIPILQLPAKGRRVMLIRPRVTFAAQLIQSLEDL